MVRKIFQQSHSNSSPLCLFQNKLKVVSPGNNSRTFTFILMTCKLSVFSQPRMYADDTSLAFSGADLKHIDGMYRFYFDYKFTNRFSGFFFILKLLLDHRSEIKINQILKEK